MSARLGRSLRIDGNLFTGLHAAQDFNLAALRLSKANLTQQGMTLAVEHIDAGHLGPVQHRRLYTEAHHAMLELLAWAAPPEPEGREPAGGSGAGEHERSGLREQHAVEAAAFARDAGQVELEERFGAHESFDRAGRWVCGPTA